MFQVDAIDAYSHRSLSFFFKQLKDSGAFYIANIHCGDLFFFHQYHLYVFIRVFVLRYSDVYCVWPRPPIFLYYRLLSIYFHNTHLRLLQYPRTCDSKGSVVWNFLSDNDDNRLQTFTCIFEPLSSQIYASTKVLFADNLIKIMKWKRVHARITIGIIIV